MLIILSFIVLNYLYYSNIVIFFQLFIATFLYTFAVFRLFVELVSVNILIQVMLQNCNFFVLKLISQFRETLSIIKSKKKCIFGTIYINAISQ